MGELGHTISHLSLYLTWLVSNAPNIHFCPNLTHLSQFTPSYPFHPTLPIHPGYLSDMTAVNIFRFSVPVHHDLQLVISSPKASNGQRFPCPALLSPWFSWGVTATLGKTLVVLSDSHTTPSRYFFIVNLTLFKTKTKKIVLKIVRITGYRSFRHNQKGENYFKEIAQAFVMTMRPFFTTLKLFLQNRTQMTFREQFIN